MSLTQSMTSYGGPLTGAFIIGGDMFRNILSKYYKMKKAESDFEDALRSLPHISCPYCGNRVDFCYDKDRGLYWMSCDRCGLHTSSSKEIGVVTYQWTQMDRWRKTSANDILAEQEQAVNNPSKLWQSEEVVDLDI